VLRERGAAPRVPRRRDRLRERPSRRKGPVRNHRTVELLLPAANMSHLIVTRSSGAGGLACRGGEPGWSLARAVRSGIDLPYLWARRPGIAGDSVHPVHAVSSRVAPSPPSNTRRQAAPNPAAATRLATAPGTQKTLSRLGKGLDLRKLVAGRDLNPRPLGYEQADPRPSPSQPVAQTPAGLSRRHRAVSSCLTLSGLFRGVLVTIMVTKVGIHVEPGEKGFQFAAGRASGAERPLCQAGDGPGVAAGGGEQG
jgi:hypothetical protein